MYTRWERGKRVIGEYRNDNRPIPEQNRPVFLYILISVSAFYRQIYSRDMLNFLHKRQYFYHLLHEKTFYCGCVENQSGLFTQHSLCCKQDKEGISPDTCAEKNQQIVPPPITVSPSYSTTACPFVMARCGSSKTTCTVSFPVTLTVAHFSG